MTIVVLVILLQNLLGLKVLMLIQSYGKILCFPFIWFGFLFSSQRAPLMLTFSVFESTKQASLVKEYPHLTTNTSLNIKSAPNVTASRFKQVVAVPTEIPKVQTDFLAATTIVPTEDKPSLDAVSDNATVSDLQGESRSATKNSLSKSQSSFVPTVNASSSKESHDQNSQSHDQNSQCAGPSKLCAGPSKLPACPVKRPPGPSKHPPKTKSTSLGKRTASTPIPIAPAPAKISALNNSVMKNIVKTNSEQSSNDQNSSRSQPRLVSFLPLEPSQSSLSEASHIEELSKSRSTLNFSASSAPTSATSSGKDILSVSRNNKPPSAQVFITETTSVMTSCSSRSTSLSSNQPFSTKPKPESSFKTFMCVQNQSSRHLEASSSTLSSCTSSLASTLPPSSDTVSIMQSSSSTAVASPTPASSASPTPAAIPSQQSQTQSLDKLHTNTTPIVKQTEVGRPVATNTSSKPPCQTDQKYMLSCKPEAPRPCKIEVSAMPTNIHYENHSGTPNCGHRVTSGFTKCEVNSATASKSSIVKTEHKPFGANSSSTVSSSQSNPAKNGIGDSSDASPPSNGAKISAATCANPKQNKQKKIADIANTLHKRVSDALLSMVSKHANSPNRRPSQSASPGLKSLSIPQTPSDLRETAIMNALSCPSFSVKQSVQNMPPERHLFVNGPSLNIPENNHNDEPLNLVKRDREMAKFMNGMFILDIPPSIT